jgi:hypothetical protein
VSTSFFPPGYSSRVYIPASSYYSGTFGMKGPVNNRTEGFGAFGAQHRRAIRTSVTP